MGPENQSNTFHFKQGDIVQDGGLEGVVITDRGDNLTMPIEVCFKVNDVLQTVQLYTRDGKTNVFHKQASLEFINRPPKIVQKQIEYWANLYTDNLSGERMPRLFLDKTIAEGLTTRDRIALGKVVITYETEEAG